MVPTGTSLRRQRFCKSTYNQKYLAPASVSTNRLISVIDVSHNHSLNPIQAVRIVPLLENDRALQ